jgi:hypothetical protein
MMVCLIVSGDTESISRGFSTAQRGGDALRSATAAAAAAAAAALTDFAGPRPAGEHTLLLLGQRQQRVRVLRTGQPDARPSEQPAPVDTARRTTKSLPGENSVASESMNGTQRMPLMVDLRPAALTQGR